MPLNGIWQILCYIILPQFKKQWVSTAAHPSNTFNANLKKAPLLLGGIERCAGWISGPI